MATTDMETVTFDELRLAGRNHAMPLEALRYDVHARRAALHARSL